MDRKDFVKRSFTAVAASACASAFRAGLQTRAFEETALDCLTYFRSRGAALDWSDHLTADKEKQVLDAWQHRSS